MAEQVKVGLWVRLEAKPGKEQAVADFLRAGLPLAQQEPATPKMALVSPRGRRKEIPSSTVFSSNAIETLSKTMTSFDASAA